MRKDKVHFFKNYLVNDYVQRKLDPISATDSVLHSSRMSTESMIVAQNSERHHSVGYMPQVASERQSSDYLDLNNQKQVVALLSREFTNQDPKLYEKLLQDANNDWNNSSEQNESIYGPNGNSIAHFEQLSEAKFEQPKVSILNEFDLDGQVASLSHFPDKKRFVSRTERPDVKIMTMRSRG